VDVSARRYRYVGLERDDETGLYAMGARYYAAWLGRWTSADPLGIGADGPGVYNYTRGSPVVYVDPGGMQSGVNPGEEDLAAVEATQLWNETPAPYDPETERLPAPSNALANPVAAPFRQGLTDTFNATLNADNGMEAFAGAIATMTMTAFSPIGAILDAPNILETTGELTARATLQPTAEAAAEDLLSARFELLELEGAVASFFPVAFADDAARLASTESRIASAADDALAASTWPPPGSASAMAAKPEGEVILRVFADATPAELAQADEYARLANEAIAEGHTALGRVSTKGALRAEANAAAKAEKLRAARAGTPYQGVAGHAPDTTWIGTGHPPSWVDMSSRLNLSFGAQARGYPVGFIPTNFTVDIAKAP
jgi:RHS repeat-associated protein